MAKTGKWIVAAAAGVLAMGGAAAVLAKKHKDKKAASAQADADFENFDFDFDMEEPDAPVASKAVADEKTAEVVKDAPKDAPVAVAPAAVEIPVSVGAVEEQSYLNQEEVQRRAKASVLQRLEKPVDHGFHPETYIKHSGKINQPNL